ncbi:DUF29 family protein [Ramlibacter sp. 2FC]|uniref:DUF29 family protein n=1 Tax=Ramlibacter sp. 2FC TaxID=2502188 RepID=UPI0010F9BBCC|nr:DUF29 family protein [Ramlibacter sp. 2FC]
MTPIQLDIPARFDIPQPTVLRRGQEPEGVLWTGRESEIYDVADVRIALIGPGVYDRMVHVLAGETNYKSADELTLYVGIPDFDGKMTHDNAFRVLEALAYGFLDFKTRESISGLYRFAVPTKTAPRPADPHPMVAYDEDFVVWCRRQAQLLTYGRLDALDIDQIVEELLCLARAEQRAFADAVAALLTARLTNNPEAVIRVRQLEADEILAGAPSMLAKLQDAKWIDMVWNRAVANSAAAGVVTPEKCPWPLLEEFQQRNATILQAVENEQAALDRCTAAARGEAEPQDQREAEVLLLAGHALRSRTLTPAQREQVNRLTAVAEAYFEQHPDERLEAGEAVRRAGSGAFQACGKVSGSVWAGAHSKSTL